MEKKNNEELVEAFLTYLSNKGKVESTQTNYRCSLRRFFDGFEKHWTEIDLDYVEEVFFKELVSRMNSKDPKVHLATNTIVLTVVALRRLFRWIAKKTSGDLSKKFRDIESDMEIGIVGRPESHQYLSFREGQAMLDKTKVSNGSFRKNTRALAIRLLALGLRKSEVVNLKISDVNLDTGIIAITKTKRRKNRTLSPAQYPFEPFSTIIQDIRQYLDKFKDEHPAEPHDYLLRKTDGKGYWHKTLDMMVKGYALDAIQRDNVRVHDWRHWACTHLSWLGVSTERIKDWAGHSSAIISERYLHTADWEGEANLNDDKEMLGLRDAFTNGNGNGNGNTQTNGKDQRERLLELMDKFNRTEMTEATLLMLRKDILGE